MDNHRELRLSSEDVYTSQRLPCDREGFPIFPSAVAKASRDNDRSRFLRMPRSTSASRSDAAVIQTKSADSDICFNSVPMSVFRIYRALPIDERQIPKQRIRVRISASSSFDPPRQGGTTP